MKSERVADALFVTGMLAAIGGFFVSNSSARGWLWFGGFGLCAVRSFMGTRPGGLLRLEIARGFYLLLMALFLSSGYLWPTEPVWLKDMHAGAVVLAVAWLMIEQKKPATGAGTPSEIN